MFTSLGSLVTRHARWVLIISGIALVAAAVLGVGAFGKLGTEGAFQDPHADSTAAENLHKDRFGDGDSIVLLVTPTHGSVETPDVAQAAATAATTLRNAGATNITSYWQTPLPQLRSADGKYGLIVATVDSDNISADSFKNISPAATVQIGGGVGINLGITGNVGTSLAIAEAIAVPIILVLLVFAFGSVVAALLPLVVGVIAIFGTFAELYILGSLTQVAIYAINLTTALGLALAIDYALLLVSRYREELAAGHSVPDAVTRALNSAGRTIVFSALTVVAALAVLLMFPMYFLRSFAYAGIGVVIISAAAALIVLPALLTVLGQRVNAGRLPWLRSEPSTAAPIWGRLAALVMRRPLYTAIPVILFLGVLAAPLMHINFGMPDDRVLRTGTDARDVGDVLRTEFPASDSSAIDVVIDGKLTDTQLRDYSAQLTALPNVRLLEPSSVATATDIKVVMTVDPRSDEAKDLVSHIRNLAPPGGHTTHVGGETAQLVDTTSAIGSRLPYAALLIVITTFVVLFLFTGSVLQPIRSLLLNGITLAATTGLMVWIFQDGHFSSWLQFEPLPLDMSMLVLLFCIAFGLSMDYEVIVLSRIKELHDQGVDNVRAVSDGLTHSGRIVTTAAALIAVSFLAFGTASVSFLQLFGIGAGIAVLLDATLVRAVLVPACQRALGKWAWWSPQPLARLHSRIGIAEQ